jgi:DNA-binding NarL/FixJ family response regulator
MLPLDVVPKKISPGPTNANVKVLIASGYAKDQQIKEMMEHGCSGFIQKPFSIDALSQKVMNILND